MKGINGCLITFFGIALGFIYAPLFLFLLPSFSLSPLFCRFHLPCLSLFPFSAFPKLGLCNRCLAADGRSRRPHRQSIRARMCGDRQAKGRAVDTGGGVKVGIILLPFGRSGLVWSTIFLQTVRLSRLFSRYRMQGLHQVYRPISSSSSRERQRPSPTYVGTNHVP